MTDSRLDGIGIVLSGGGSRGIAHIGVLRALEENGIAPDRIAGVSSGAIVGALYAAGYGPAEMLEFFHAKNPFHLSNLALAKPGIFDTDKVVADFEEYFPDNRFEALNKKLSVVATDMLRGEPVVFDSGPLIGAVLASSSVPVVFTPTEFGGRLFSDGGIVNNFPVEPLEGRCRVILGVHASPQREIDRAELSNSFAVLKRALEVGMIHGSRVKFERCDAVIRPHGLERFGPFEVKQLERIEAAGHEAAIGQMAELARVCRG